MDQAVVCKIGLLRRGGLEGLEQLPPHIRPQDGNDLFVLEGLQLHLLQPQALGPPGGKGKHIRGGGVFKLDLVGKGGEESVLHPLVLQKVEGPLGGGELLVAEQLLGDVAHLPFVGPH